EVDRFEVIAIELRSDVVAERSQLGANTHLLRLVGAAERDVVNGSRAHDARPDTGNAAQIDNGPRPATARSISKDAALLAHQLEAEGVGEKLSGELIGVEPEGDRVEAAYGVFSRHSRGRPSE